MRFETEGLKGSEIKTTDNGFRAMGAAEADPLIPTAAVIRAIRQRTYDTATYTLSLQKAEQQAAYAYRPGQFNMVSVLGFGEAPLSISSEAWRKDSFDHTVRAVGNVTRAMTRLQEGDILHIRGPYGRGWPMERIEGRELLLVAGGIGLAPLRPVIAQLTEARQRFGRVEILYGARTPADLLFTDEFPGWQGQGLRLLLSVDQVPEEEAWPHNVGVVTTLFPQITVDPREAIALVCGPEIMMKFVVLDLLKRGYAPERIYLSLERRMECGVAMCGHCQMGPKYVCKHGPVFSCVEVKNLFGHIL